MINQAIEPQVYIYSKMSHIAGYVILEKQAANRSWLETFQEPKTPLWLLRESKYEGMLTIDLIYWDQETSNWMQASVRMALTEQGWIESTDIHSASVSDSLKTQIKLSAQIAHVHESSLLRYIKSIQRYHFTNQNWINPDKNQQTKSPMYSTYVRNADFEPIRLEVELLPGVLQALSCGITGRVMKEPVVMKQDKLGLLPGWEKVPLFCGHSYEKLELVKLNIQSSLYVPNFNLKKIIDRVAFQNNEKIMSLEEERLQDSVELETYINPYIIPSGHSFSKITIEQLVASEKLYCPITRQAFLKEEVVPNINLNLFMKEWPACKERMLEELSKNKLELGFSKINKF